MPIARKLPCPLCQIPTRPSAFNAQSICPMCADSIRDAKRENSIQATQLAAERGREAFAQYKKAETCKITNVKRREEREAQKARKIEKQRLSEIHREQASKELARRSLLHYTERKNPKYDPSWAHELVASQIEEFYHAIERKESPRMIISLPSRFGKALKNKEKILTANRGWTNHGDLRVGDFVFGSSGLPTQVVATSEEVPCNMEIEFSSGQLLTTHENHEWQVYFSRETGRKKNPAGLTRILETKQLYWVRGGTKRVFQSMEKNAVKGRNIYQVPNAPRLELPHLPVLMSPYALGLWLGDGSSASPTITHHPSETACIEKLVSLGYERTRSFHNFMAGSCQTYFGKISGVSRFMNELKALNLINNKHIPEIYFSAGTQQRLELLAGILDSDGTTDKHGRITLVTTSARLRDDYLRLIRTLGWRPYVTSVQPALSSSGVQGKQVVYQVGFQPDRADIPCALERKIPKRVVPLQRVGIVDVHYIENGPMGKCIQVEAEDGMYLAGETLIPTHNSELASISGPGWALGHWPQWKFVLASYSDNLPMDFSRNIRDQLQSPDFKALFPSGGRLSPTDASAQAWSTVQGGALRAIGVGGGLLGFGADCLTIDDPVKSTEEAHSPQALDKLWQWFTSVAYSRLMPGGGILVIQQRMAVDDLVGRLLIQQRDEEKRLEEMRADIALLKQESPRGGSANLDHEIQLMEEEADELDKSMDRWRYLEYPALATQDEYYDKKRGEIMRVPSGHQPHEQWKPLRKRGEALHEKRYSRSYLLKLKRANPKMFQAMYMLNPIMDEGAYFNIGDFQRYERGKHPKVIYGHVFCAWDLAIGTKQSNDYTVGVAGMLDWEGKLWLLDIIRGKFGDVREVADLVIDLHQKWGASITGIEHTHVSMALGPILKTRMAERDAYIVIADGKEKLVPTADKAVRARQLQGLCRGGKFYVPEGEEFDDFVSELTRFMSGGHDDSTDAASWLAILALRNPPPRKPGSLERAAERARSWLAELMDDLIESDRGESSYMES